MQGAGIAGSREELENILKELGSSIAEGKHLKSWRERYFYKEQGEL